MGRLREQPQSPLLPPHPRRAQAARPGGRRVRPYGSRHPTGHEDRMITELLERLSYLTGRRRFDNDLDAELHFDLEPRADELEAAGLTRSAARGLRRNPAFAATAVACLALGIGANTTMFSVTSEA